MKTSDIALWLIVVGIVVIILQNAGVLPSLETTENELRPLPVSIVGGIDEKLKVEVFNTPEVIVYNTPTVSVENLPVLRNGELAVGFLGAQDVNVVNDVAIDPGSGRLDVNLSGLAGKKLEVDSSGNLETKDSFSAFGKEISWGTISIEGR